MTLVYNVVSMPSRAYTSFLPATFINDAEPWEFVSMPSRAYTSFLPSIQYINFHYYWRCQCPLGLIHHFYEQHPTVVMAQGECVNALSGLYIISTVPLQKPRFYAASRTCFCRYLSEYSDNSCFSCMLTFWTYLMRCTYS